MNAPTVVQTNNSLVSNNNFLRKLKFEGLKTKFECLWVAVNLCLFRSHH